MRAGARVGILICHFADNVYFKQKVKLSTTPIVLETRGSHIIKQWLV